MVKKRTIIIRQNLDISYLLDLWKNKWGKSFMFITVSGNIKVEENVIRPEALFLASTHFFLALYIYMIASRDKQIGD